MGPIAFTFYSSVAPVLRVEATLVDGTHCFYILL